MTDFQKIKNYYKKFDEWHRLDTPAGELERILVLETIEQLLDPGEELFDLGGGAGRYTYELAKKGYQVHLADLSPELIAIAREKLADFPGKENVKSIAIANAIDLTDIKDEHFDNVLLFGPLYHLTSIPEIRTCLQEVYRILKPSGKLFASFIPYQCGLISILQRALGAPQQVSPQSYRRVFQEGIFNNQSTSGFQEGYYLKSEDLVMVGRAIGFEKIQLRSIRGIGYQQEKELLKARIDRPLFYEEVIKILHQSADDPSIVDTCGHAIYIAKKANSRT